MRGQECLQHLSRNFLYVFTSLGESHEGQIDEEVHIAARKSAFVEYTFEKRKIIEVEMTATFTSSVVNHPKLKTLSTDRLH